METDRAREDRVRRLARKHDCHITKSREWKHVPHADNYGEYMLVHSYTNSVVLGSRYDASLDEIEGYLRERVQQ